MKKNGFLLICVTVFLILSSSSCKKDSGEPNNPAPPTPVTSYLKYDGKTYELTQGFFESYNYIGNAIIRCCLVGKNVSLMPYTQVMSGISSGFEFFIMLPVGTTTLPTGTFSEAEPGQPWENYCYMGYIAINHDWYFDSSMEKISLQGSGILITCAKNGDQYVITCTGKDSNNKQIELKFKGAIKKYN